MEFVLDLMDTTINTWHLLQCKRTAGIVKAYVDGVELTTGSQSSLIKLSISLNVLERI